MNDWIARWSMAVSPPGCACYSHCRARLADVLVVNEEL